MRLLREEFFETATQNPKVEWHYRNRYCFDYNIGYQTFKLPRVSHNSLFLFFLMAIGIIGASDHADKLEKKLRNFKKRNYALVSALASNQVKP